MAYIVDPINNTLIDDEKPLQRLQITGRKKNTNS